MTRSIGIAEPMRWSSALGASVLLAIALHTGALQAPQSGAGASALAPAGSAMTLDPRLGALAARRPGQSVEAIVQFKSGPRSADFARSSWSSWSTYFDRSSLDG